MENGETQAHTTIIFQIPTKVSTKKLILPSIGGNPYFNGNYLVDDTSQNKVSSVVELTHLNGALASTNLDYALAFLPLDLETNWSCVMDEHVMGDLAYMPIAYDESEEKFKFNGSAIKSPVEVRVIDPTIGATRYGDILNRHYEVQTEVVADIVHPEDAMWR